VGRVTVSERRSMNGRSVTREAYEMSRLA
jgi:hypothetical protein